MTHEEFVRAVKKATQEDAKLSPEEYIRELYEAGIIDAKGRVFSESLRKVENLLKKKGFGGFSGISAFHIGRVPGGAVRLHEKAANAREAEAPYDQIRKLIQNATDQEDLWKALEAAGYRTKPAKPGRKKTG